MYFKGLQPLIGAGYIHLLNNVDFLKKDMAKDMLDSLFGSFFNYLQNIIFYP